MVFLLKLFENVIKIKSNRLAIKKLLYKKCSAD